MWDHRLLQLGNICSNVPPAQFLGDLASAIDCTCNNAALLMICTTRQEFCHVEDPNDCAANLSLILKFSSGWTQISQAEVCAFDAERPDRSIDSLCTTLSFCGGNSINGICGCSVKYDGQNCGPCEVCEDGTGVQMNCGNVVEDAVSINCLDVGFFQDWEVPVREDDVLEDLLVDWKDTTQKLMVDWQKAWPDLMPSFQIDQTLPPTTSGPTTQPATEAPTSSPSSNPSSVPVATTSPTNVPTRQPTTEPSTSSPSSNPSSNPSSVPVTTSPTNVPTRQPTTEPSTSSPSSNSSPPSLVPVVATDPPTLAPSNVVTNVPSGTPLDSPSTIPSLPPTTQHTSLPSSSDRVPSSTMPSTASGGTTLIPSLVPADEMQEDVTDSPNVSASATTSPPSFSPSTTASGAKKMKRSSSALMIPFSLLWMSVAVHLALL